jgi:hypothetical protein
MEIGDKYSYVLFLLISSQSLQIKFEIVTCVYVIVYLFRFPYVNYFKAKTVSIIG